MVVVGAVEVVAAAIMIRGVDGWGGTIGVTGDRVGWLDSRSKSDSESSKMERSGFRYNVLDYGRALTKKLSLV